MPCVITVNTLKPAYPSLCPFCSKRHVNFTFTRKYKKPKDMIPGGLMTRYEEHLVTYLSCAKCAHFLNYSKWIALFLFVVPWIAFLYVVFNDIGGQANVGDFLLWLGAGSSLIALGLLVARVMRLSRLRVGYVGNDSVMFFSSNKNVADEFARLNHTVSEYKFLVVKFR